MRVLAGVVAASAVLTACGDGGDAEQALRGYTREPVPSTAGLSLPVADAAAEPFELVADDDELLVVYFGYTSCPDVCPTTMSDLRVAMDELGPDADRVDVAMATIDPERDTPEVLGDYVGHFVEGTVALRTTDDEQLRAAADVFGATYSVTPDPDGGEPEVMHSGSVFAVDDAGQVVVTWPFGTPPDDYVHDIEILLGRR